MPICFNRLSLSLYGNELSDSNHDSGAAIAIWKRAIKVVAYEIKLFKDDKFRQYQYSMKQIRESDLTLALQLHFTAIKVCNGVFPYIILYLSHIIVGVTAMDQYVYAVGGYDATYQLPSVERYCVETNQWEMLCQMNRPRSALGVAVVNSKLYAVGEYFVTRCKVINLLLLSFKECTILSVKNSNFW